MLFSKIGDTNITALDKRQCTLKLGQVCECTGEFALEVKFFLFIIDIDQSKMTKSRMFNLPLKLTDYKCFVVFHSWKLY